MQNKKVQDITIPYEGMVKCDCGMERIVLWHEPGEIDAELSIWKYAYDKISFRHRLRYAWHVLRTGTPYKDQICLNKESLLTLAIMCRIVISRIEEETKND